MKRSLRVEQAIIDAIGSAMIHNRLHATAGDLIAALLRADAPDVDASLGVTVDTPVGRVIGCADRAAESRHQITALSDILQCILDECSEELSERPDVKAALETALEDARREPGFRSVVEESRAINWRLETTYESGKLETRYFASFADAARAEAGLPPAGPGLRHTASASTGNENDPIKNRRILPPGSDGD